MQKTTCIIVDDEIQACNRIEKIVKFNSDFEILFKIQEPNEAINKICYYNPNIVFLDIEMPNKNGFEVVSEVKNKGFNPVFVFVTGHQQYAIRAIRESAFDYMLKPINIIEFKEFVNRYKNRRLFSNINTELLSGLSEREQQITQLILKGYSSKEIAERLFISKSTVDGHRKNILDKTACNSFRELIGRMFE